MQCKNHPETGATTRCTGCAESFCGNCVVELNGEHYCGACKVMALGDRTLVAEHATQVCPEAKSALTCAVVGLFIFGIVLEPIAIATAFKAKKRIEQTTHYTGSGKATAALLIAIPAVILAVINFIAFIMRVGNR
jgi:heme/copper-type cytochrome/quinol oxidase subunit 2